MYFPRLTMHTICEFVAVVACIFTMVSSIAYAEQMNAKFVNLGLEDGLAQENIRAIHQDSDGFMWFGTQEGLHRYDGYEFKIYTTHLNDANSISSPFIYDIEQTSDGLMWIGTTLGVNSFDRSTETFVSYKNLTGQNGKNSPDARVMLVDSRDRLWVGTKNGLFVKYRSQSNFESVFLPEINNEARILVGAIVEDKSGFLWVSVHEHGLYRVNPDTKQATFITKSLKAGERSSLSNVAIHRLYITSDDVLWVTTLRNGIYSADLSNITDDYSKLSELLDKQPTLPNIPFRALYEDRLGNFWVGSDIGLYLRKNGSKHFKHIEQDTQNPSSLIDNKISSLFLDEGGVFWVGTFRGISKWNTETSRFDYFGVQSNQSVSLSNSNINAISLVNENNLWVATHNGLNRIDTVTGKIEQHYHESESLNTIRENNVMALQHNDKNELWIGYRSRGLSILNLNDGAYIHYNAGQNGSETVGSLKANGVTDIMQTRNGDMWVSTFGGGVYKYNYETKMFQVYEYSHGDSSSLSSNRVISMFEDSLGMIWLGTWDGGTNILDPQLGVITRINEKRRDSFAVDQKAWAIHEDSQGNIWMGAHGIGLFFLSSRNRLEKTYQFEYFSQEQGLPSGVVYGILEDESGFIWVSTNRGISRINITNKEIVNFESSDGLQGNEFNAGAFHKGNNGKFYFGGTNGVTGFDPKEIAPNMHIPPVVLTRFHRLNEITDLTNHGQGENIQTIEIGYRDYLVAFEFAGLDYVSPEQNKYAYKLIGFDEDWVEARGIRKATYTNLPSGKYIFQVIAANNDGVWNEAGARIKLIVHPAPWFSWWAYTIYALCVIWLLTYISQSYMRRLKKEEIYSRQLEQEVKERTAELQATNELLLKASVTDQLTSLYNRRYMQELLETECPKAVEQFSRFVREAKQNDKTPDRYDGQRLFVMAFDLDGFKPINDTYGHEAGDRVIIKVSELLKSEIRSDDALIRWGGDEFILIGTVQNLNELPYVAERVRKSIAREKLIVAGGAEVSVTSSIGFSCFPFHHQHPELLAWDQVQILADKALYQAKSAGRNAWVGYFPGEGNINAEQLDVIAQHTETAIEHQHIEVITSRDKA